MKDKLFNLFYRIRFWYYRNFRKSMLRDYSPVHKQGRELMFFDGFTGRTWSDTNTTLWKIGEHWGLVHPEKPNVWYGPPKEVGASAAAFMVKHNPKIFEIKGKATVVPFEVSLLASNYEQQYGRFECRCTLPYQRGSWAAFWLWGKVWPPEIDVFEVYGRKTGKSAGVQEMCVHYGEAPNNKSIPVKKVRVDTNKNPEMFHEFAVEWTETAIEFFTDGIKVAQFTDKKILDKWFNIPIAKMTIIINNSISDEYVKNYEVDYYSDFLVDYIRVYDKKGI